MEDNNNIQKQEEELKNLQANIYFLNNTINDFDLPLSLNINGLVII